MHVAHLEAHLEHLPSSVTKYPELHKLQSWVLLGLHWAQLDIFLHL